MFLLPKGSPLFENLAVSKLKLPEVLSKLSIGGFTGYASFVIQSSTTILVFESGKLVSALLEEQKGNRQSGFEAISNLIELMVSSGSGAMNVYKLSKDLTMCIHALLQGEILYKAQELKLIDIRTLLAKIKADQMNGCLRIYTDDRSAIIFYKYGNPLGFFHDGSHDIETSSTESQKIAGLPGAKIDLYSTHDIEELMGIDLLEVVNIQRIWDSAVSLNQSERDKTSKEHEEQDRKIANLKLADLEEQVKVIVTEYLGKVGRGIVDKEVAEQGGNTCLMDETRGMKFLLGVERSAKLLIGTKSIQAMMTKISSVTGLAKSDLLNY